MISATSNALAAADSSAAALVAPHDHVANTAATSPHTQSFTNHQPPPPPQQHTSSFFDVIVYGYRYFTCLTNDCFHHLPEDHTHDRNVDCALCKHVDAFKNAISLEQLTDISLFKDRAFKVLLKALVLYKKIPEIARELVATFIHLKCTTQQIYHSYVKATRERMTAFEDDERRFLFDLRDLVEHPVHNWFISKTYNCKCRSVQCGNHTLIIRDIGECSCECECLEFFKKDLDPLRTYLDDYKTNPILKKAICNKVVNDKFKQLKEYSEIILYYFIVLKCYQNQIKHGFLKTTTLSRLNALSHYSSAFLMIDKKKDRLAEIEEYFSEIQDVHFHTQTHLMPEIADIVCEFLFIHNS